MTTYQQFTLDTESAKQADGGGRIETTGKYTGIIKSMEFVTSRKGTQGFEVSFETDSKEYTTFQIWTSKADGSALSGVKQVNALLACVGVRGLTPTNQQLEKWDYDVGQKVKKSCVVAPEMTGKRVGLLLQRENYINNNGQPRHEMKFSASFNAESELMAKEILERKTTPELLHKALDRLIASGDATRQQSGATQNNGYGQPQGGGYGQPQNNQAPNDLDDDLPF